MKNPKVILPLALLGAFIFFALLAVLAPETYADWKHLTFHEPAHYIFEFQNEIVVGLVLVPLWNYQKRKAVERAIMRHDATFHPHSHKHGLDTRTEAVVK